jgi:hypothetical protein
MKICTPVRNKPHVEMKHLQNTQLSVAEMNLALMLFAEGVV